MLLKLVRAADAEKSACDKRGNSFEEKREVERKVASSLFFFFPLVLFFCLPLFFFFLFFFFFFFLFFSFPRSSCFDFFCCLAKGKLCFQIKTTTNELSIRFTQALYPYLSLLLCKSAVRNRREDEHKKHGRHQKGLSVSQKPLRPPSRSLPLPFPPTSGEKRCIAQQQEGEEEKATSPSLYPTSSVFSSRNLYSGTSRFVGAGPLRILPLVS